MPTHFRQFTAFFILVAVLGLQSFSLQHQLSHLDLDSESLQCHLCLSSSQTSEVATGSGYSFESTNYIQPTLVPSALNCNFDNHFIALKFPRGPPVFIG